MSEADKITSMMCINGPGFTITATESDVRLITAQDLDREGIKMLTEALQQAECIHIDMWLKARERSDA